MSNIYTCTNATGDIDGLAIIDNGVKITYTLSGTTAGSVEGNTVDGTYEAVGDDKLTLASYTGVVTVNNVKTQRTEQRLLTHTDAKLGVEEVANGGLDTDTDWNKGTGWTIADGKATYDGASGTREITNDGGSVPTVGNTYLVSISVLAQGTGNNSMYYGSVLVSSANLTVGTHTFRVTATGAGKFTIYGRDGDVFEINNVSVKEVSTENKYYIDGVEQDVTPPLPSSTTAIDLNDTAVIGYADTITERHGNFKVYSTVLTQAEIDAL